MVDKWFQQTAERSGSQRIASERPRITGRGSGGWPRPSAARLERHQRDLCATCLLLHRPRSRSFSERDRRRFEKKALVRTGRSSRVGTKQGRMGRTRGMVKVERDADERWVVWCGRGVNRQWKALGELAWSEIQVKMSKFCVLASLPATILAFGISDFEFLCSVKPPGRWLGPKTALRKGGSGTKVNVGQACTGHHCS